MASSNCTFCFVTPSALNVFFPSVNSSRMDNAGTNKQTSLEKSHHLSEVVSQSYVFKALGIYSYGRVDEIPFPSCENCWNTLQGIETHFQIISDLLNGIKEKSAPTVTETEEILGMEAELVNEEEDPLIPSGTLEKNDVPPSPKPKNEVDPLSVPTSFPCKTCHAQLPSKRALTYHMEKEHWDKTPCSICGMVLSTAFRLKYHMIEVHKVFDDDARTYPCSSCPAIFAVQYKLNLHTRSKHGDEVILKEEERKPQFSCDTCQKSFSALYNLKRHMITHASKDEKIKCEICDKLVSLRTIRSHKKKIHGKGKAKKFVCYFCGMVITESHHLKTHLRTHTKERIFICPNYSKCGNDFTRFCYLQRHLKRCEKGDGK